MNGRIVFNPYSHKAHREGKRAALSPFSHKYLNLLLDTLIQAANLDLKEFGELSSFCFQCWRQEPIFNRERFWMKKDAFNLENEINMNVFISDLDFSAQLSTCSMKTFKAYFTLEK
jgi:hypothetical protein